MRTTLQKSILPAIAAILLLLPSAGIAQMKPIEFEEETLENGLHVIYNIDKSAPMVATVVHYKVGSRDENPERTGFAHFFEHLMFEATEDIPRASIDKYVNEAGGRLNAHTSFDETVYKFEVPANEIRLPLWIESQRMRGLQVAAEGVETQRGVVKEERNVRIDNQPYGSFLEKMFGNLFEGGSYSWTPIGSAQHIDVASIQEFRDFYDKFYQPNNACLVLSGDFDIDVAKKYVKQYFSSHPKGKKIVREEFKLPPLKSEYRETVVDDKAQLPALFIGYRGPKLGDKDYYAAQLLQTVLAAGESSRLYKRLVDQDQIAVQAAFSPFSLEYSGAMIFIAVPTPGNDLNEIEETIYEEIDKFIKEGMSDEEFRKAKNIMEVSFISGKKDVLQKAMTLARYYSYFGNADLINTEIEQFNTITKEDIIAVAEKYLKTNKRVVLSFVPKTEEN